MTNKEMKILLHANGVPRLVANWSYSTLLENEEEHYLAKKITPLIEDIEGFIKERKCLYLYFDKDPVLASQIAATFLKQAYNAGYMLSRWTNPGIISDYKAESWDNGDAYSELIVANFVVIDKVGMRLDDFKRKTFDEFCEDRLLEQRSTIFVGTSPAIDTLGTKTLRILQTLGAEEVHKRNTVPVC